jgi:CheY-like chemotaxis protein
MRILIIDDSPTQRTILAGVLQAEGYTAEGVGSAEAAYRRLQMPDTVDLILTDLHMPGTDGIEACQRIHAMEPCADLPIIVITGSTDTSHLRRAFAAGAIDYITKPPNEVELLARVRSALRLKHEMDSRKARESELRDLNDVLAEQTRELDEARQTLLEMNAQLERRVEAQVVEIRARAREVTTLNAQLRAQVQERSRELAEALRQLARAEPRESTLVPGAELRGRVRIARALAEGGMGEVFLGHDLLTGSPVVIKVLRQAGGQDVVDLRRFIDAAAASAAINHPAIVRTLHIDVTPDGRVYQIMEFVDGETLQARLRRGPLPPDVCVRVGGVVADALAAAHHAGVIHRDVTPANLMLAPGAPGVRVLDFGIAKARRDTRWHTASTRAGWLLGTPAYMSPEQIRDAGSVTPASDVYSLGAVLYEALTGRPVFAAQELGALIVAHATDRPADVRDLASDVPDALAELTARCLEKDPLARPAAREVADALAPLVEQPDGSVRDIRHRDERPAFSPMRTTAASPRNHVAERHC